MLTINPKEVSTAELHSYMLGAIAPRPIAFASTVDENGNVNLSPFSFFNVFSANPPILIFSPARRVKGNTIKHTLENAIKTKEVVINIVNFDMVQQMSLSSTEYAEGVNEFLKSGLTEEKSQLVKPPRVKESPASFECKINEIIPLGSEGGAGNLIVCEVLLVHIKDEILDNNNKIDPFKLDAVARMGGDWYCRAQGDAIFEVEKPIRTKGIGVDALPETIRNSNILTGNDLGRLGNSEHVPSQDEIINVAKSELVKNCSGSESLHLLVKKYLDENNINMAVKTAFLEK